MLEPNISPDVAHISRLLQDYSFDVEYYQIEAVVASWLRQFESIWVSHAITEALYQGRYKIVSVHQILHMWQRRGSPIRHFNREFESIILGQSLLSTTAGYGDTTSQRGRTTDTESRSSSPLASQAGYQDEPPDPEWLPTSLASEAASPFEQLALWQSTPDIQHDALDDQPDPQNAAPEAPVGLPNFQPVDMVQGPEPSSPDTIQPFVPKSDASTLHQRLKAVVRGARDS